MKTQLLMNVTLKTERKKERTTIIIISNRKCEVATHHQVCNEGRHDAPSAGHHEGGAHSPAAHLRRKELVGIEEQNLETC